MQTEDPACQSVLQDDLEVRFKKVIFPDNRAPPSAETILPLTPVDFQISSDAADLLRQSACWSVIREEDCWECGVSFKEIIEEMGGLPSHPMKNDQDGKHWAELCNVIHARHECLERTHPLDLDSFLQIPEVWKDHTLDEIAEVVHNEHPETSLRQAIGIVGPHNFGRKFYAGRARPEEIEWFLKEALEERPEEVSIWNVPEGILVDVLDVDLQHSSDFTAYSEGSPTHPSWPAMHSAGSVASCWLAIVMDLSQDQLCEAMALDWGVSCGRTVAGVHFPADNIAGLTLGQELLARRLPGYFSERFGSDEDAVREKIQRFRFDWNNYLDGPCSQLQDEQQMRIGI